MAWMKDPSVPHLKPFYMPIANEGTSAGAGVNGKLNDRYVLEPVGYGMRFAAQCVGLTVLPLDFNSGDVNATAYADERDGKTYLVVIMTPSATKSAYASVPRGVDAEWGARKPRSFD